MCAAFAAAAPALSAGAPGAAGGAAGASGAGSPYFGKRLLIADRGGMLSFEIVEINPVLDEKNRTAELAVELTASAFGKKIL